MTEQTGERSLRLLQRASPVAERVQLNDVVLAQCSAWRAHDLDPQSEKLKLRPNFEHIGVSREAEHLYVFLRFGIKGLTGASENAQPSLMLDATFVVVYSLPSFEGLTDENLQAFAEVNGVFNAWPFWREFVCNTTSRMGIQPVTIPVYRVSSGVEVEAAEPSGAQV